MSIQNKKKVFLCFLDGYGLYFLCCAWRDKKAKKHCVLVTTKHSSTLTEVQRRVERVSMPQMIAAYNQNMNGCDRIDQAVSYYGQFRRKTIKWWKQIFLWLLEVVQVNAHILYQLANPDSKVPLLTFKNMLIDELTEKAAQLQADEPAVARGRRATVNPIERLSNKRHIVVHKEADRNCAACSTPQKRQRTKFFCSTCEVYLHPQTCFELFHSAAFSE